MFIMNRKEKALAELGKKIALPDGRIRIKFWYKGKLANRYYREVKCSCCDSEIVLREVQNLKKQKYTFCDKCKSKRAAFYYPLSVKAKSSGHILEYNPEHPFARKGYVPQHRLVMEREIGRILLESEKVHHIDCVKDNNKPSNLYLTDSSGHNRAHNSLNECVKHLMKIGVLFFDKQKGIYTTKNE